jgi:ribosomal protein S18 acetylase RimI-like enzyme
MNTNITFSAIQLHQVELLQQLSIQTFTESFAKDNTEENLKDYFNQVFSIKALSLQINNPFSTFFFVFSDQLICGYFKINIGESQTEIKEDGGLELERIYILAAYQKKKIGENILKKIKEIATLENKKYIWLGVWEQNTKAIRFYERFGFKKFDTHIYPIGDDPQIDWMMKLML